MVDPNPILDISYAYILHIKNIHSNLTVNNKKRIYHAAINLNCNFNAILVDQAMFNISGQKLIYCLSTRQTLIKSVKTVLILHYG